METDDRFEEALAKYVELAQAKTAERKYRNGRVTELEVAPRRSKRYVKIVEKDGAVFAFIDKTNGDVLYPRSYSEPAKHPRGNIYNDDPLKGTGPYGPEQLPNWRKSYGP